VPWAYLLQEEEVLSPPSWLKEMSTTRLSTRHFDQTDLQPKARGRTAWAI